MCAVSPISFLLEKLHISPDLSFSKQPVILTNDPFRTMNNMRVLKLDKVAVHSIEILDGGCMPNLEELNVSFVHDLESPPRIESFPNFPKLAKLRLHLTGAKYIHPKAFDHLTQLSVFELHCKELEDDTFETGVAACFMRFHVKCKLLKLKSSSVSQVENIGLINYNDEKIASLETVVPLSGLKRLIMYNWTYTNFPFHKMTNLEYLQVETSDLSIINSGQLKYLPKLRVLKVENSDQETQADSCKYLFNFKQYEAK
jgi:hypothetical protein